MTPQNALEIIFDAFYENLENTPLVKKFFVLKLMSVTQPFVLSVQGTTRVFYPVRLLLDNINMRHTIGHEDVKDLLHFLQTLGWDVNAAMPETPLYFAVSAANMGLFSFLLELGADPTLPANEKAVDCAHKRDQECSKALTSGVFASLFTKIKFETWGELMSKYSRRE